MTGEDKKTFSLDLSLEGRGSFSASGPDELVFRALAQFREEIASRPVRQSRGEERARKGSEQAVETPPSPNTRQQKVVDGLPPVGPYVRSKGALSNPEAIAVVAVWDKRKNRTSEFEVDALRRLFNGAGRKPAANFNRDVRLAAQKGWLEPSGDKYAVTVYGEEFVDGKSASKEK